MARKKWKDDPNHPLSLYCRERREFKARPVTKSDKWCQFRKKTGREVKNKSPYGIILTVENFDNGLMIRPRGYIVRSKIINGILYLQVVKGLENYRIYHVRVNPKSGVVNIQNCTKGPKPRKY